MTYHTAVRETYRQAESPAEDLCCVPLATRYLPDLERSDLVVTPSTWHYQGGGCC